MPTYVREALDRLDDAGHVAYVVGGSVRDFLLERSVKDHDIATSASPDELCALFPDAVTVGKAFGVLKVPIRGPKGEATGALLEIASFREDLEYTDHRHPKKVRFAGPDEDASRRDFTINALFFDPKTSRILDSTGGMEDLKAKLVRAIGDPSIRFQEDALRLLRAVRFATTLDFKIDESTASAISAKSKLIRHVSGERIRDELNLMLRGPRPAGALERLSELGLLGHILPEVDAMKGVEQAPTYLLKKGARNDVWSTTLQTIRYLARSQNGATQSTIPSALAWAALLYDIGKPVAIRKNRGANFNGHEIEGAAITRVIGDRLRMPRAEIDRIVAMLEDLHKFRDVFKMREATLERFVRLDYFDELLQLHRAQALSSDGNLAYCEFASERRNAYLHSAEKETPRLIDGKDLIQLGFSPGPEFSQILHVVEDLALEKKLTSKEQALEYVVSRFVK